MSVLAPQSEAEAEDIVRAAAARGTPLDVVGGGTRDGLGRSERSGVPLSSRELTGITLYEPAELVIGARAGTPLETIETALKQNNQMLAFEPMDHRSLFGTNGSPTIGGVAAANVSGPRRISAGAARDHLLGIRLVNGRGETIKAGGRVMKNVTGLDLVKLACGAYGTTGLLTEIVFKVLPRPETSATLLFHGLADAGAVAAMSRAMGSPFEVTAAAHLPREGRTLLRLEGFAASVAYRVRALGAHLADAGESDCLEADEADPLWADIRDARVLGARPGDEVWRVSLAPSRAAAFAAGLAGMPDVRHLFDWAGGLIWFAAPETVDLGPRLQLGAGAWGGHASLVRGSDQRRMRNDIFQPLAEPLMNLTRGIKASFDPHALFNRGRMYEGL